MCLDCWSIWNSHDACTSSSCEPINSHKATGFPYDSDPVSIRDSNNLENKSWVREVKAIHRHVSMVDCWY